MPSLYFTNESDGTNKVYRLYDKSLVNPIYNAYVSAGYDVKKITAKNGAEETCAILVKGSYANGKFAPYKSLMNNDSVGAKIGGANAPQFLIKNGSNTYGFMVLNQTITLKYKYQVIQIWGSYSSGDSRPISTTTSLKFTTWSSRFPLENDYLCSFGKNTFTLKAGTSSGSCGDTGVSGSSGSGTGGVWGDLFSWIKNLSNSANNSSYSEYEPANGLKCMIFIKSADSKVITCNNVTKNNWDSVVPAGVRDSTAILSTSDTSWKEWSGPIWWFGHKKRSISVNYLDSSSETWKTVSNSQETSLGYGNGWAYQWPDDPDWNAISVSFSVPGGQLVVNESRGFTRTYKYEAVRGSYGSGTASENWKTYTYTAHGSSTAEESITFSFAYDG